MKLNPTMVLSTLALACAPVYAQQQGVTKNEIRVAMPSRSNTAEQLRRYVNRRYEMYGRQIVFVEPDVARRLDLTAGATDIVPAFLDSPTYSRLTHQERA